MTYSLGIVCLLILQCLSSASSDKYKPDWTSLDTRPLPSWYDKAKIGIFIHWGVFSVPSYGSEWFWYNWKSEKDPEIRTFMENNYPPHFQYSDFAPMFKAEFYDPIYWAEIFKNSGARYVVLTSKHHEGYTLWPSKTSWNWNSLDIGSERDLLGDLCYAVKTAGLHFGVYHSLYEWYNPLYLDDKRNNFTTNNFVKLKVLPEMRELIVKYKPEVLWSDGDWEAKDDYWQSKEFIAWLYNKSPVNDTIIVNDRWGSNILCKHGDFLTCKDRYIPKNLMNKKWENAMTLDLKSWGYARNSKSTDYITRIDLLETLLRTVSYGGNILINIGPTSDGRLPPIMEERLLQLGAWLNVFGEAIYETKPWKYQNDSLTKKVWYTFKEDKQTLYCTFFIWPHNNVLKLEPLQGKLDSTQIMRLTENGAIELNWKNSKNLLEIALDNGHASLTPPYVLKIINPLG